MRAKNSSGIKSKLVTFLLIFTMCAWLWPWNLMEVQAATAIELKNPRVTVNSSGDVEKATWDCVWFGNYKQSSDGNGGFKKEPIKWRVLSVNGNDVFLIADQNLDCKQYNETDKSVTWETCTLRSWLNGYDGTKNTNGKNYSSDNFIDEAFSPEEQKAIQTTDVTNGDNPRYGTEGGCDTRDQIYLLSIEEAENTAYGFSPDHDDGCTIGNRAENTDYAKRQGASTIGSSSYWWLRSPGGDSNDAAYVDHGGYVPRYGSYVYADGNAVRPALHLNLESGLWSDAGTVSTDGSKAEKLPTYKISYDANGGTGAPSAQTKTYEQELTLSSTVPTRKGYDFLGWSESKTASAATYTAGDSYMNNSGVTLYAVWELIEKKEDPAADIRGPQEKADRTIEWDCVWFGNYEQNSDGNGSFKREPIKWRVLSVNGDEALLLADKNLDAKPYNGTYTDVTWATSTLRSWLNGYGTGSNQAGKDYTGDNFLDVAFSPAEQAAINQKTIQNPNNSEYGTAGGSNTTDNVFFLSIEEVTNSDYGFSNDYSAYDKARRALNTDYAKSQGAWTSTSKEDAGNGSWWLRSPGSSSSYAAGVSSNGSVSRKGAYVSDDRVVVRPALFLNLKSNLWSYAGTVSSGENKQTNTPTGNKETNTPTENKETNTPTGKKAQTISASSKTLTYKGKTVSLNAKTDGDGRLSYSSSNQKVVTVSGKGKVTPKECGSAKIAIKAAETSKYKAAVKTITVKVLPKKPALKLKRIRNLRVRASWTKTAGANGYCVYMYRYDTKKTSIKKTKKRSANAALVKGKKYQFKVRAYRKVGKKTIYGPYSKAIKIKC